MRLSVVIPVYCEERTIEAVIEAVSRVDFARFGCELELVICDDGSTDGTARALDRAERPGLLRLRHPANAGKGAAIRTALAHLSGEWVLIQDADLEYAVEDYPRLLQHLAQGAPAVYGSRFLERRWPADMRPANFLANKILTLAARLLYGLRISDEATCLKLVRTDLLRAMALECQGFEFCAEVTAKLGLAGVPIREVPVGYRARRRGAGKKVRARDGLRALYELLRWRAAAPRIQPALRRALEIRP